MQKMRNANAPTNRGDVNNVTAPLRLHLRQSGKCQIDWRPKHQIHRLFEIGTSQRVDWSYLNLARIVDEDVESSKSLRDSLDERFDLFLVCDVARKSDAFYTFPGELVTGSP